MNTTNPVTSPPTDTGQPLAKRRRAELITAAFLIGIGAFLLLAQLLQANWINLLILPTLGLAFVAWGVLTHNPGLEVPGGILLGLGLALVVIGNSLIPEAIAPPQAIMMFGLALGFLLVIAFTPLAGGKLPLWPILPALPLAGLGFLFLAGDRGLAALVMIGQYWPIVLILAGVAVIIAALRKR